MRAGEHRMSHVLAPAIVFCLSFTVMFVALGMSATGIGSTLRDNKQTLDTIAGILIIGMGDLLRADAVRRRGSTRTGGRRR